MSIVTFNRIAFGYNGEDDLLFHDFSLSVGKGEKIAIKSDSGTGKTTLLRLLLGFEQPVSGEIRFNGTAISENNYTEIRRATAWLPQDLNIGDGTVKQILQRPFEFVHNRNRMPETDQVRLILEELSLSPGLLEKPLRDLSTGQRQRVGLALCHLLDRPLLLLDEPTSALDRSSKQKAANLLLSDPNKTVISTTHDPFWLELCDEIIEL
ncbi:ATP-binding cassette domain-containing protein [Halalkalibaculum sp. DA3122]|uniref:ABC transporter ATP-binding protein n=1 Tax=unclassified Halalkalibaculum TaxID=2964617 RepID=UPI0037550ABD